MKSLSRISFCLSVLLLIGCGKKDPVALPERVSLMYPEQNSACITGLLISDTLSELDFIWSVSANTSEYEVHLKNLLTGATTVHASKTSNVRINLAINVPYSWYVVSKSGATSSTSKSDVWKFYNSGPTIFSHAPFPAEAVSPKNGQVVNAGNLDLSWFAEDVDKDIVAYDLYFGTTSSPPTYKTNIVNSFVSNISVNPGATYYWKVITKDAKGNTSSSELLHFKVN